MLVLEHFEGKQCLHWVIYLFRLRFILHRVRFILIFAKGCEISCGNDIDFNLSVYFIKSFALPPSVSLC